MHEGPHIQFKQALNATERYNKAIYDAMIIYIHTISIVEMLSELVSVTVDVDLIFALCS